MIPDGPLAQLPFECLVVDAEPRRYLLDTGTPISYGPSATILHRLATRAAPTPNGNREPVLTVADPALQARELDAGIAAVASPRQQFRAVEESLSRLPHTASESKGVVDNFRKVGIAAVQLLGQDATEARVRTEVAGRRIVHLACHGLADHAWGNYFGALALTPGPDAADDPADDGFLTLPEIYALDLRSCELAVLSACNTNHGPYQRGEGAWALSRAFLAAGTRRVVASNWVVEDASVAELVRDFTHRLAAEQSKRTTLDYARALHLARVGIRRQEQTQDPFHWASLVLVGPR